MQTLLTLFKELLSAPPKMTKVEVQSNPICMNREHHFRPNNGTYKGHMESKCYCGRYTWSSYCRRHDNLS